MDWKIIFLFVFPWDAYGNHQDFYQHGDSAIAYNYIDEDTISQLESQQNYPKEEYTCSFKKFPI